jgi:PAS domain S-box-containing protein
MTEGDRPTQTPAPRDRLRDVVESSPLPVGLVDLDRGEFVALSAAARRLLRFSDRENAPVPVAALSDEPEATEHALALVRDRKLDGYAARRTLRSPSGEPIHSRIWLSALDINGSRPFAVVFFAPAGTADTSSEDDRADEPGVTLGVLDGERKVDRVSADVEDLLGIHAHEVLGRDLIDMVHPDDVGRALFAFERAAADDAVASVVVRVRRHDGEWRPVRVAVGNAGEAADGNDHTAFTLTPEGSGNVANLRERIVALEQRLWQIAHEVAAAGVIPALGRMPDPAAAPGLQDLSSRQWEIVTRLIRGERVETMAREMFISRSTVRNHLSVIFRKVGVRSQAELVERLRST